jgi:hypothetical protein
MQFTEAVRMTIKTVGVFSFLVLVLSACGADDPQSRLDEIEALRAKGFPMTDAQKGDVDRLVSEGAALLADGQRHASSEKFALALKVLKQAADADRFNKSE